MFITVFSQLKLASAQTSITQVSLENTITGTDELLHV